VRLLHFFLAAFAFFISALSAAPAQMPTLRGGAMLECSGLPCIDVVVGGRHLRMLIDTGNVNSILDAGVAQAVGLSTTPVKGSDGKPIPGFSRATLPQVVIGEASLGQVRMLVMDIATYIKRDRMPACDGTLAYTAFSNRILQMDYKSKTVRFSDELTHNITCPGFCGDLSYPTFGKNGPPIVVSTGFNINARELTVQIDTLFSGAMLVYPTAVEKLGLAAESQSSKKQFFPYTDDGVEMIRAEAESEGFGPTVLARRTAIFFATPSVHLPDGMFDGTVGHALFQGKVLTLDLHGNHMWIA
jgi:hypothetical protein